MKQKQILIVGFNNRSKNFVYQISSKTNNHVIGYVDDIENENVICSIENFRQFIKNTVVDDVYIFLPVKSYYYESNKIVQICLEQGINVRFDPNIFEFSSKASSTSIDDLSMVKMVNGELKKKPTKIKRLLDIIISFILICLTLPLMIIISLMIICGGNKPIFTQERVGLNKRRFKMYKFQTMVSNAEDLIESLQNFNESEGPTFKIQNDPRITFVGKFLRKTSLDELPQLFNVLIGNMSLVGPRPLPIRDFKGFSEDWHRRRFSVRPGITCLWQIKGRSSITFDRWMELDIIYIDNWSFWLDFKILLLTIPSILKKDGAY